MASINANYVVIEAGDPDELHERVRLYLQDNFLPQGGVCIVALGDGNYLYAQAMVFDID